VVQVSDGVGTVSQDVRVLETQRSRRSAPLQQRTPHLLRRHVLSVDSMEEKRELMEKNGHTTAVTSTLSAGLWDWLWQWF